TKRYAHRSPQGIYTLEEAVEYLNLNQLLALPASGGLSAPFDWTRIVFAEKTINEIRTVLDVFNGTKFQACLAVGYGGSGKTLTGLKLGVTYRSEGWQSFYSTSTAFRNDNALQWLFAQRHPTYLVIDDVHMNSEPIIDVLLKIKSKSNTLSNPIRVLLLGREGQPKTGVSAVFVASEELMRIRLLMHGRVIRIQSEIGIVDHLLESVMDDRGRNAKDMLKELGYTSNSAEVLDAVGHDLTVISEMIQQLKDPEVRFNFHDIADNAVARRLKTISIANHKVGACLLGAISAFGIVESPVASDFILGSIKACDKGDCSRTLASLAKEGHIWIGYIRRSFDPLVGLPHSSLARLIYLGSHEALESEIRVSVPNSYSNVAFEKLLVAYTNQDSPNLAQFLERLSHHILLMFDLNLAQMIWERMKEKQLQDERFVDVMFNLGVVLLSNRAYLGAVEAFGRMNTLQPERIDAIINLGIAEYLQRDYLHALELLKCALEKLRVLDESVRETHRYNETGCFHNIGVIHAALGNHKDAIENLKTSIALKKKLVEEFPKPIFRKALAESHNTLGSVYTEISDLKNAGKSCRKALAIQKKLKEQFPSPLTLKDYGMTQSNLAVIYYQSNLKEKATKAANEAVLLFTILEGQFQAAFIYELAQALGNLALVYDSTGKTEDAKWAHEKSIEKFRKLYVVSEETFAPDLARGLINLGHFHRRHDSREKSRKSLEEALEIITKVDMAGNECLVIEAMVHNNLALVQETFEDSELEFNAALEIYQNLAMKQPEFYNRDVARILYGLGNMYSDWDKTEDAEQRLMESLGICSGILTKSKNGIKSQIEGIVESLLEVYSKKGLSQEEAKAELNREFLRLFGSSFEDYSRQHATP
ncbi:MAG: tetratricopeptide repeat protein, partial [Candidatus Thorarchaeota archaeon]